MKSNSDMQSLGWLEKSLDGDFLRGLGITSYGASDVPPLSNVADAVVLNPSRRPEANDVVQFIDYHRGRTFAAVTKVTRRSIHFRRFGESWSFACTPEDQERGAPILGVVDNPESVWHLDSCRVPSASEPRPRRRGEHSLCPHYVADRMDKL